MTFAEAQAELDRIADGRACSLKVETMRYSTGELKVLWRAWIQGVDWTEEYLDAESALEELRNGKPVTDLVQVDVENVV